MTAAALASRTRRRARMRGAVVIAAIVTTVLAASLLAYAATPMMAEEAPLAAAAERVTVTETAEGVVLTGAGPGAEPADTGLIFFAGARVDPAAYADTLSGVAASGITVVIARPTLNFAILETRPLSTWQALAPGVTNWMVGGHSLGGVRACMFAESDEVSALVLFGSYCSVDLAASGLPVLSLAGENDGLSTPAKITDAAPLLPASARFVTIPGASHAQFGAYGIQPGDGPHEADPAEVRDHITAEVLALLSRETAPL